MTDLKRAHGMLCQLVHQLNGSLCGLYLAFYIVNLYFMWNHLMSLLFPPISSTAYLGYQTWALLRQLLRFSLVTRSAVAIPTQLGRPNRILMTMTNVSEDSRSREIKDIQVNRLPTMSLPITRSN